LLAGRLNKEMVEKIDFIRAVERSIAVCCFPFSFLFLNCFVSTCCVGQFGWRLEKGCLGQVYISQVSDFGRLGPGCVACQASKLEPNRLFMGRAGV